YELTCIVEIPKGSRNKYEYDPDIGAIKLDRFISASVVYPTDYGYVPETLAPDGDPLDVLVCVSEPTFPGCIVVAKAVGLFRTATAAHSRWRLPAHYGAARASRSLRSLRHRQTRWPMNPRISSPTKIPKYSS